MGTFQAIRNPAGARLTDADRHADRPVLHVGDGGGFANSLEWATSCPPPRHNFTSIPRIRSDRPAFDLHYPHIQQGRNRIPAAAGRVTRPDQ
jgi:cytochrome c oxidase subunit 1